MIWILLIAGLALVILAGFAFLVAGVHSTDRHMRLRDTSDASTTRGFARRVLGVYVIAATIGANLARGLGHGPIAALVSAWPWPDPSNSS